MHDATGRADGPGETPDLESTAAELERARAGDARARERLFARFLPVLRRWAHQQLPRGARDLSDTGDLVQATLMRALAHLDRFESRGEGAFLGYLRQILLNAIRDEARRAASRRPAGPLHDGLMDPGPTALEEAVGRDAVRRYESGLERLTAAQREAVVLKVELGWSNAEIAQALGKPSVDAVRVLIARALVDLAEAMDD